MDIYFPFFHENSLAYTISYNSIQQFKPCLQPLCYSQSRWRWRVRRQCRQSTSIGDYHGDYHGEVFTKWLAQSSSTHCRCNRQRTFWHFLRWQTKSRTKSVLLTYPITYTSTKQHRTRVLAISRLFSLQAIMSSEAQKLNWIPVHWN
jgi:hypothetical protein